MSANGGKASTERAIAAISRSCDARPFIFQFPAINGRIFSSHLPRPPNQELASANKEITQLPTRAAGSQIGLGLGGAVDSETTQNRVERGPSRSQMEPQSSA